MPTTIPTLPSAPLVSDSTAVFNTKAFAFNAALAAWGTAANLVGTETAASASAVVSSQTAAATSQAAAAVSQAAAAGSVTAAAGSVTAAAGSVTAATAVLASTQALSTQFNSLYLGPKPADPTLDNAGLALVAGAFYTNTVNNSVRAYTSSGWVVGISSIAGVASFNGATGAVVYPGIIVYAYDNRATLRSGSPAANAQVIVTGLGMFVFVVGSVEPDDDETSFSATGGVWELTATDPDYVFSSWQADFDLLQKQLDDIKLRGSFYMSLTGLAATSSSSFNCTVVGAAVGDIAIAAPNDSFGEGSINQGRLSYSAYVSAINTVTVSIRNASAGTASMSASTWAVLVMKQ